MPSIKDLITERKSVRTYDGTPLKDTHKKLLQERFSNSRNPFGIPVEFRFLDARENHLTSPVIIGTDLYFAAKVQRQPHFELAYGYSFEDVCLYASSLGIGTVMLAGTLNRDAFEKAMEVQKDEVMPCASPVGYPAAKKSLRETVMRRAIKADERLPFGQLFFDGSFDRPLTEQAAGPFADALRMTRLSPSAANRQPVRAVLCGKCVHFYEARSIKESPICDIQLVDIGIALCHFDLTAKEDGMDGHFVFGDPGISAPAETRYIVTYTL